MEDSTTGGSQSRSGHSRGSTGSLGITTSEIEWVEDSNAPSE